MSIIDLDQYRGNDSVFSLATKLNVSAETLLKQFNSAGVDKSTVSARVSVSEKDQFLKWLKERYGDPSRVQVTKQMSSPVTAPAPRSSTTPGTILILITFDLNYADRSIYKLIDSNLRQRGIKRSVLKSDGTTVPLPSNLFAVKYRANKYGSTTDACADISKQIEAVFKALKVHGNYFVSAASGWAWKVGGTR
jgi:hypothetical protein